MGDRGCMALPLEHWTPDFGLGHDLTVVRLSPMLDSALMVQRFSTWDSLSPSPFVCLSLKIDFKKSFFFLIKPTPFLCILIFIIFERETAWTGEEQNLKQAPGSWVVSTEPDRGLKPTNCKIMTWAEVRCSANPGIFVLSRFRTQCRAQQGP